MKRIILSLVTSALLAGVPLAGQDQDRDGKGRIQERKARQQKRIAQGVASGELTAKETKKLERKEAKLNKEIRRDRRDGGGLSAKERVKIEKQQDKLSKEIYKEKHDKQKQ